MRLQTVLAVVVLAAVACSSPDRTGRMSPTAPSSTTPAAVALNDLGGISGPMDVRVPPRNETFAFRNQLETKYQTGLNRPLTTTYVDREGEVVWLQEYVSYRINGCDHEAAAANVMAQIDGRPAPAVCPGTRDYVAVFPPRNDSLDFRRRLEEKYRSLGRALISTYVDTEGAVIWVQEYLRYRANECDHANATQKVFAQIDGGPVSPDCVPLCRYRVAPGNRSLNESAQSSFVDILGEPGGCTWNATSSAAWLTILAPSPPLSNDSRTVYYNVSQNTANGGPRTGRITFTWPGGSATHAVTQDGSAFITTMRMTDPFRSGDASVTECHLQSPATPCNLIVSSNMPGSGPYTYAWNVYYEYNGVFKQTIVTNNSNTFTITDACGSLDSAPGGIRAGIEATVTVTDSLNNTHTLRTGDGTVPIFSILKHPCS